MWVLTLILHTEGFPHSCDWGNWHAHWMSNYTHSCIHTIVRKKGKLKLIASCITELKRTVFYFQFRTYTVPRSTVYIQSTCQGRFLKNKGDWCSIYVESQNMTLRLSLSCFRSALWSIHITNQKNFVFKLSTTPCIITSRR